MARVQPNDLLLFNDMRVRRHGRLFAALKRAAMARVQPSDFLPSSALRVSITMDALPNEVLMMILEYLQDAELLLDVVPMVCRRWRALSREPRLWADVRVKPANPPDEALPGPQACLLAPRAILHAPVLRSLHFPWKLDLPVASDTLLAALRQCRATLQELHLDDGSGVRSLVHHKLGDRERARLASMLRRSRSVLRALSLGDMLLLELGRRHRQPGQPHPHMPRLLRHVAALERLETLSLRVHDMKRYSGQLSGGVLRLRHLSLAYHYTKGRTDFVQDLLAGSAASLRHLELVPMDTKHHADISLPAAVLVAVAQCTELRSLDIVLTDMAVVGSMPRLERLGLLVARGWCFFPNSLYAAGVFGNVVAQLVECPALASLRRLELQSTYNFESWDHAGQEGDWDADTAQLVEVVFAEVGRVAAEVTAMRLRLGELTPRDMVAAMVDSMLRLQTVDLGPDRDHHLLTLFSQRGVTCCTGEE